MPSPTDRNLTALPSEAVNPRRRDRRRQALHHFTQLDQVTQLVNASEADAELGFMARLLALCSLPRSNPWDRHEFKRVNGPYTLCTCWPAAETNFPTAPLPRVKPILS